MVNYGELVATPNTKLLLHLNGNSTDSSGNGNNGTDTNISYVNGVFGQGASFNGTSSRIVVSDSTSLRLQTFTISTWLKINGSKTSEQLPIRKDTSSNRNLWGFKVPANTTNISSQVYNGTTDYVSTAYTLSTGVWTNVIMTVSGSGGTMKFYINGKQYGTDVSLGAFTAPTANLGISFDVYAGNSGYFNGSLDEVIIENRVWSATEILNYYNQSKGVYAPRMN